MKIVVSYVYYEKENTKRNLTFFLTHGLLDTRIILYLTLHSKCSVPIPKSSRIIILKRKNKGFDFGAHINIWNTIDLGKYSYFVMMNDSCLGPFVKNNKQQYLNKFIQQIKDNCLLVGTMGVTWAYGYFLVTNFPGIKIIQKSLNKYVAKHKGINTYRQAVECEKLISSCIVKSGYTYTTLIKKSWNKRHTPWNVIFVKENKIKYKGKKYKPKAILNFITPKVLRFAIKKMNQISNK